MRELIVDEFLTLDGVAQAPGGAEEDTDGGFAHGGWHMEYTKDETSQGWVLRGITEAGGFVLGRRTWEIFAGYWPNAPEDTQVVAKPLNALPKHVASRTLAEPLGWENSTLLRGDLAEAIGALKAEDGKDLHVIGSTELVRGLIAADLVDELRLMIDPVLVGGGKRIFSEDGVLRHFRLAAHEVSASGALLAAYRRAA